MTTQTIEQTIVNRDRLHRIIDAFPDKFAKMLADYVEELINEMEEEEDIAYLEAHKDEIDAFRQSVFAKYEAKHVASR